MYDRTGMSPLPKGRRVTFSGAYEEGEEARSLGFSRDYNPYDYPEPKYIDWDNGWSDENKRGY